MGICSSRSKQFKLQYRSELRERKKILANIAKLCQLIEHLDKYPDYPRYVQRRNNYEQSLCYYRDQLEESTDKLQKTIEHKNSEWDLVLARQLTQIDATLPHQARIRLEDLNISTVDTLTSPSCSTSKSKTPSKKASSAKPNTS